MCPTAFLSPFFVLLWPYTTPNPSVSLSISWSPSNCPCLWEERGSPGSPTLASLFTPLDSSDQRSPSPWREVPRFLSVLLSLLSQSIWAVFNLYFSHKAMTIERKDNLFDTGWPWYCLDSGKNWLRWIFFSLKVQNRFFFTCGIKNNKLA